MEVWSAKLKVDLSHGPSLVGEKGPELFVPKSAGTIIPNKDLMGGGGNYLHHKQHSSCRC